MPEPALAAQDKPYAPWARPWSATIGLVALVTICRLAYLAWGSPYTLIEDEAHYWEWARRLDWSYYSKGPGIAWTIATAWALVGDAAWAAVEFGVRAPAPFFAATLSLSVAWLARDAFGDGRAGFVAAAVTLCMPVFQLLALLMTIDGPYAACWAVATLAAWKALARGRRRWWAVFGLALAGAFLFKYTALLLVPGVMLFAILRKGLVRRELLTITKHGPGWWVWVGIALAGLGLAPVGIWNAQHDWVTVRHLLGHLGVAGSDLPSSEVAKFDYTPNVLSVLEFVGLQIALVGPAVLLIAYGFRRTARGGAHQDARPHARAAAVFCLSVAAPVLGFYAVISPWVRIEGNWPLAGYVSLAALAGWAAVDAMDVWVHRLRAWRAAPSPKPKAGIFRKRPEQHRQIAWHATMVVGVAVGLVMLRVDWVARLPGLGRVVPVGRLMSAAPVAAGVEAKLDEFRRAGVVDPIVMTQHYGRASLLAFYLPGRPIVYCASSRMAGRTTQYDVFPETNLDDPALLGRDAILLGATLEQWRMGFESVEERGVLEGDHKGRPVFVGKSFKGFP